MKKAFCFAAVLLSAFCFNISFIHAQVAISANGNTPNNSAMLDIQSNSKGLLPPRMNSTTIAAIPNPADGLVVYNTDTKAMQVYGYGKGWNSLEIIPSRRIFVSDSFPDPLYPLTDYDYMGVFYQPNAFKKNIGTSVGQWITKQLSLPDMSIQRQFAYTGSSLNKVLVIGNVFHNAPGYCDSCITAYNLVTNQFNAETTGYIRRYDEFTATTDTSNSRIFIWGGIDSVNFDNPFPDRTFRGGFIYDFITGGKVLIDSSASAPQPRVGHSAIWSANAGKLLIFCGVPLSGGAAQANIPYSYDPTTKNWNALANFPLAMRRNTHMVYDGSDRIIVWGGTNFDKTVNYYDGAIYSISSNSWSLMASLNAPTRAISNASWTGTDMLLSSANINLSANDYKAWRYTLATNTWAALPNLPMYNGKTPIVTYGHLWNGVNMFQISYLIPGTAPLPGILWSYSFGTNTWTALPGISLSYFDIKPVQASDAVLYHSGQGYFYRYDPAGGASATYQVQDQNFHYYKKK